MNKTFEKHFPHGLLIGERKEKISTPLNPERWAQAKHGSFYIPEEVGEITDEVRNVIDTIRPEELRKFASDSEKLGHKATQSLKTTLVDGGIKEVFMTKEELTCLRCKYLTLGVIVFAVLSWIIMIII